MEGTSMSEYVLLTTTDRYKTIVDNPELEKVSVYEYYFFGKKKATFTICKINNMDTRILIQGVSEVFPDNSIPLKVFPRTDDIKDFEKEIFELDINEESKVKKV
jgi:hypothetical protein